MDNRIWQVTVTQREAGVNARLGPVIRTGKRKKMRPSFNGSALAIFLAKKLFCHCTSAQVKIDGYLRQRCPLQKAYILSCHGPLGPLVHVVFLHLSSSFLGICLSIRKSWARKTLLFYIRCGCQGLFKSHKRPAREFSKNLHVWFSAKCSVK